MCILSQLLLSTPGQMVVYTGTSPDRSLKVNSCFLPFLLAQIGALKHCVPRGKRRAPSFRFLLIHSSETCWEPLTTPHGGRYREYSKEQERGHSALDLYPLPVGSGVVRARSASESPGHASHGAGGHTKIWRGSVTCPRSWSGSRWMSSSSGLKLLCQVLSSTSEVVMARSPWMDSSC